MRARVHLLPASSFGSTVDRVILTGLQGNVAEVCRVWKIPLSKLRVDRSRYVRGARTVRESCGYVAR